jgi:nucleoside phosphorylase
MQFQVSTKIRDVLRPHPLSKAPSEKSGKPEIVVITALDEELDYLYEFPLGWSDLKVQKDGISYRRGHLAQGIDVIAASAHSAGLVAVAILTAKVLKEWRPSIAAMVGICGGIKAKGVNIGDIIVASRCFHYQYGAFDDGKIIRELLVENIEAQVIDIAEHLARRTRVLSEIQQSLPRGFKKPNTVLQSYVGPMASADLVVKDVEKLGEAVEADRKTIAIDMESYAFMSAARLADTRWSFVVKSVSDFADAKKDDEYREYAKYTSTRFFIQMAQSLVEGWKQR